MSTDTKNSEKRKLWREVLDILAEKDPAALKVLSDDIAKNGLFAENTHRKDFTPSEMVAIKRALDPKLREEGARRKLEGQRSGGRGRKKTTVLQNTIVSAGRKKGSASRSADQVGAIVGKSGSLINHAEIVVRAAERDPDKYGALAEEMDRTGNVSAAYKELKQVCWSSYSNRIRQCQRTNEDFLSDEEMAARKAPGFISMYVEDIASEIRDTSGFLTCAELYAAVLDDVPDHRRDEFGEALRAVHEFTSALKKAFEKRAKGRAESKAR